MPQHHHNTSSFVDFRRVGTGSPRHDNRKWAVDTNTLKRRANRLQRSHSARETSLEGRRSKLRNSSEKQAWASDEQVERTGAGDEEEAPVNREELLSRCVSLGDRVIVDVTPNKAQSAGPQGQYHYVNVKGHRSKVIGYSYEAVA